MKHGNDILVRCIRIFVLMGIVILVSKPIVFAEEIHATETWIKENPLPSKKELISFVYTNLTDISDIQNFYDTCNTILEYYSPEQIPYEFYVIYAKIATLKFDFGTSSVMYYAAYELSGNKEYLLQSIIQEYESGNIRSATIRLQELLTETITPNIRVTAIMLLSNIAVIYNRYDIALQLLQDLQSPATQNSLNAHYYHQWHVIATLANNTEDANTARYILEKKFPGAIEVYVLNSPNVTTLPLPSTIFVSLNKNSDTTIAPTNNTQENNNINDDDKISYSISNHPSVGYQVASYKDIDNAKESYAYYLQLWKERSITTDAPIVTTKSVLGNTYYQVVFPLQESQRESQTNALIAQNIEGFIVTSDNTY